MSSETKRMKVYYCDACGAQCAIDPKIDTPPVGVHGQLLIVDAGGNTVEFWACTDNPEHISRAIERARKEDLDRRIHGE